MWLEVAAEAAAGEVAEAVAEAAEAVAAVVEAAESPRVDAQDLAEPDTEVLSVVGHVACAAPISGAHVEHPVRTELELAAVVVRIGRMRNREFGSAMFGSAASRRNSSTWMAPSGLRV